jgi:chorismate-pyruvate lyase
MLNKLLNLFPTSNGEQHNFRLVPTEELPEPFDAILGHEEHLTGIMEQRHGGVSVNVLDSRLLSDKLYCRRILLQAPCGKRVTYAVILVDLDNLPEAVRQGVREEKIPFGR